MLIRRQSQRTAMGNVPWHGMVLQSSRRISTTTGLNVNLSVTMLNADYKQKCAGVCRALKYIQERQPMLLTSIWNTHFNDSDQVEQLNILSELARESSLNVELNAVVALSRLSPSSTDDYVAKVLGSETKVSKLLLVGEKREHADSVRAALKFARKHFPGVKLGTSIDYKWYDKQQTELFVKMYREEQLIDFMVSHIVVDIEDAVMMAEACQGIGLLVAAPFAGNGEYFRRLKSGKLCDIFKSRIVTEDDVADRKNYALLRGPEVDSVTIHVSPTELLRRQAQMLAKLGQRYPQFEIWLRCMAGDEFFQMLHMLTLQPNDAIVVWPSSAVG